MDRNVLLVFNHGSSVEKLAIVPVSSIKQEIIKNGFDVKIFEIHKSNISIDIVINEKEEFEKNKNERKHSSLEKAEFEIPD